MFLIILFITFINIGYSFRRCGLFQKFNKCTTHFQKTCNDISSIKCPLPCQPGCSCIQGYVRNYIGGKCVPVKYCKYINNNNKCPVNEKWTTCGTNCQSECGKLGPQICNKMCRVGCECVNGFVRSKKGGKCVKVEDCQSVTTTTAKPKCPVNEHFNQCGTMCQPECGKLGPRPCFFMCRRGCECNTGFVRHKKDGTCIKIENCPTTTTTATTTIKITTVKPKCPLNEKWTTCGTTCQPECGKLGPQICNKMCRIGCECAKGYVRSKKGGKCIKIESCPSKCGINEQWTTCGTHCQAVCGKLGPVACILSCRIGCECAKGYVRSNIDGKCIKIEDCQTITTTTTKTITTTAKPKCPVNEEWTTCGTTCEPECGKLGPQICNLMCRIGCQCAKGYVRSKKGAKCVKIEDCQSVTTTTSTPKCGTNMEFKQCGTACQTKCGDVGPKPCIEICKAECQCKDGFIRKIDNGNCILPSNCPKSTSVTSPQPLKITSECPVNEHFNQCGTMCQPECGNLNPRFCILMCRSGCECDTGFVRHEKDGTCILPSNCPR